MSDLIEQLKDPKLAQPFTLLSAEKQDILKRVGKSNILWLNIFGEWKEHECAEWLNGRAYILKPDYQPEPEYVDYLIEICEDGRCEEGNFLGVKEKLDNSPILPHEHTYLYCLPSLPGFDHFERDTGQILLTEHVANAIYSDGKVYARFRKGES